MRAVVVRELGGVDVLRLQDVAEPVPRPGQLAIEVAYAGVNFADVMARTNGYRVAGFPFVPGVEVSGRVRALGDGVTGFEPGQPVAAMVQGGGYAEVTL